MLTSTQQAWSLGIGDPSLAGWLIVLGYLLATLRCWVKSNDSRQNGNIDYFWVLLAVFLLFLGINKQLDLQTLFETCMKDWVKSHGWYARRRTLQIVFISTLGLGMIVVLVALRKRLANIWSQHKLVWLGLILLCIFILLRAATFNHIALWDQPIIWGLNLHFFLELGALITIIAGTFIQKPAEK